ncbi:hypothetical protein PO909_012424 [Leuciscus waleckii]
MQLSDVFFFLFFSFFYCRIKSMDAVNAVQLFILVWTFTAVCQADDDISVSCENVTGTVSEEVTLTCSVSLKNSGCCIEFYKFQYPEKYTDSEICREGSPQDSCEQRNSFTCSFSSTTVMTGEFRFFIQTNQGWRSAKFTVDITEPSKPEPVTEAPESTSIVAEKQRREGDDTRSKSAVITAVTGCFIIIIIIIIMTIIYKKKPNYSQSCGFQRMFLCHKHDDNNSNFQEQNPENLISLTAV